MAIKLCSLDEIPADDARGVDSGEQRYIVMRQAEEVFVYRNQCPHLGIPLDWQPDQLMDPDREFLRCATHGALFLIDTGECIAGPCVGQFLIPVPFEHRDGAIFLR